MQLVRCVGQWKWRSGFGSNSMNTHWKKWGLIGTPVVAMTIAMTLGLHNSAAAQQGNARPDTGAVSEPFETSIDPGTKIQCNMALFARGPRIRNAQTTVDVLVRLAGPTGDDTVRRTLHYDHTLDPDGRIKRLTMVHTCGNLDVYIDGALADTGMLKGLPPGEPVIGTLFNIQTVVFDPGGPTPVFMETTQVNAPDGSLSALKRHELSGNVTLMK